MPRFQNYFKIDFKYWSLIGLLAALLGYLGWSWWMKKKDDKAAEADGDTKSPPRSQTPNPEGKTRGLRNNNPGNIVKSSTPYKGKIKSTDPVFEQFATFRDGAKAMRMLLEAYRVKEYDNIWKIITRWSGNDNAQNYIAYVEKESGFDRNRTLTKEQIGCIIAPMAAWECDPKYLTQEHRQILESVTPDPE